ncbi:hypothetical protein RRG08_060435 [Elysia crispata]|uniref:Uncharacterized protein n=1 Tax=Elysia crispata TaxID=231223 RepID=A0AAE1AND2_9GAST|nr:hypothetical protein RRG08_060435 [Elysia crispata]
MAERRMTSHLVQVDVTSPILSSVTIQSARITICRTHTSEFPLMVRLSLSGVGHFTPQRRVLSLSSTSDMHKALLNPELLAQPLGLTVLKELEEKSRQSRSALKRELVTRRMDFSLHTESSGILAHRLSHANTLAQRSCNKA